MKQIKSLFISATIVGVLVLTGCNNDVSNADAIEEVEITEELVEDVETNGTQQFISKELQSFALNLKVAIKRLSYAIENGQAEEVDYEAVIKQLVGIDTELVFDNSSAAAELLLEVLEHTEKILKSDTSEEVTNEILSKRESAWSALEQVQNRLGVDK